ncbi:MAG: hypothetical protein J7M26_01160 [Armatimonadetes bacterium]|nr:hypothetical protein [Armatimonadota bacterium]
MAPLLLLAIAGGCLQIPEAGPVPSAARVRQGHAYLGPLLSCHPLWPTLRAVQRQMWELGTKTAEEPMVAEELVPLPSFSPLVPRFDLPSPPRVKGLAPPPPPPGWESNELPEDLRVSLQWHQEQAVEQYRAELARVRAEETRRQAEAEAKLWREYQVALNNLKIQAAIGGPGADEAARLHEETMKILEQKVADLRQASQQRLALARERLAATLQDQLAQLEREAKAEYRRRNLPLLDTGASDRQALEEALQLKAWAPTVAPRPAQGPEPTLFPALAERYRQALQRQRQAQEAARQLDLARLGQTAAVLQRLIRDDVETAVRAQALAHGLLLSVPPVESPRGEDVTAQCAQWLRQQWPQL